MFCTKTFVCNYRDHTFPVVLDQVFMHAHTAAGILAHSIQTFSRSFRFRESRWVIQTFSFLQKRSIGFRSGDWLGHSRNLRCFLQKHSSRDTWPHPSSPQYGAVHLLQKKHPQRIMFPPPCFTVWMVFLGLYSSFIFLQTRRVEFRPTSSIFVSSDQMTFSQSSS